MRALSSLAPVGLLVGILGAGDARAQAVPVTADNFVRAESDLYFGNALKQAGGVGQFFHNREPTPVDQQPVIRMNRDTSR